MASDKFDPYASWLKITAPERPPNHYVLLGLEIFESDPEEIERAYFERFEIVSRYKVGRHEHESQSLQEQLNKAHACLTSPSRRATYDAGLRPGRDGHQRGSSAEPDPKRPAAHPPVVSGKPAVDQGQPGVDRGLPAEKLPVARPLGPNRVRSVPAEASIGDASVAEPVADPAAGFAAETRGNDRRVTVAIACLLLAFLLLTLGGAVLVIGVTRGPNQTVRARDRERAVGARSVGPAGNSESTDPSVDAPDPSSWPTSDSGKPPRGRGASDSMATNASSTEGPTSYLKPTIGVPPGTRISWHGRLDTVRALSDRDPPLVRLVVSTRGQDAQAGKFHAYCDCIEALPQLSPFVAASERMGNGDAVYVVGDVIEPPAGEQDLAAGAPCVQLVSVYRRDPSSITFDAAQARSAPMVASGEFQMVSHLRQPAVPFTMEATVLQTGADGERWAIIDYRNRQFRLVFPDELAASHQALRVDSTMRMQAEVDTEYFAWDGRTDMVQLRALGPVPAAAGIATRDLPNPTFDEEAWDARLPLLDTERFVDWLGEAPQEAPPGTPFRWSAIFDSAEYTPDGQQMHVRVYADTAARRPVFALHVIRDTNQRGCQWLESLPSGTPVIFSGVTTGLPGALTAPSDASLGAMRRYDDADQQATFAHSVVFVEDSRYPPLRAGAPILSLAWGPKGQQSDMLLVGNTRRDVGVFNMGKRPKLIGAVRLNGVPVSLAWEPKEPAEYFLCSTHGGPASFVRLRGQELLSLAGPASWHPDKPACVVHEGWKYHDYRTATELKGRAAAGALGGPRADVTAIAWTASGRFVAFARDFDVHVHSAESDRAQPVLVPANSEVAELHSRFNPETQEEWLAGVDEDRLKLSIWKHRNGSWPEIFNEFLVDRLQFRHISGIRLFAWSPDGQYLITTPEGQWQLRRLTGNLRLVGRQQSSHARYSTPCFSPDSRYAAVAMLTAERVRMLVFDLETKRLVSVVALPSQPMVAAWSSDLRYLATGHVDSHVLVWRMSVISH